MKKILIVGHTRSGGHFLMNSIALNFEPYEYHRRGQDLCKKAEPKHIKESLEKVKDDKTILISRQQGYSFEGSFDLLRKEYIVFYMKRDSRDVMASLYDMHTKVYHWSKLSFEDFLQKPFMKNSYEHRVNLIQAENPIHSWVLHTMSWWNSDCMVYHIKYESLYNNFGTNLVYISHALGIPLNKEIICPDKSFNSVAPRKGEPGQYKKYFTKALEKEYFKQMRHYLNSRSS